MRKFSYLLAIVLLLSVTMAINAGPSTPVVKAAEPRLVIMEGFYSTT